MPDIAKRCFRLVGGGHNKFWTVQTRGGVYFATYGRIMSAGQTQTKNFITSYEADKYARKMIDEKRNKGYVETDGDTDPGAPTRVLAGLAPRADPPPVAPTPTVVYDDAPVIQYQRGLDL